MIIKSVKLHNIRSYLSESVDFPCGSVLLSGDIGSGKSTILLAIEFAFFGFGRGSGDGLLRHGKQAGYVELTFLFEGREVIIRRGLKRLKDSVRQDEGFIAVDGVKQFCTADELKAKVLEMLGYPKELLKKSKGLIYRFTVYTPQEEMKQILFEDPQARLDTLRRVFQIEKYKLVRENSAIVMQAIRERKRELSAKIEDLPARQGQVKELIAGLALVDSKISAISPVIGETEMAFRGKQESLKSLEGKARQLNILRSEAAAVSATLAEKRRLISLKESEVSNARKEIAALKAGLESSHEVSRLCTALSKLKSFSVLLSKETERKRALEDDLSCSDKLLLDLESEIARSEVLVQSARQLKVRVMSLEGCPTCLQPVPVEHKQRISVEEEGKVAGLVLKLSGLTEKRLILVQKTKSLKVELADLQSKEKLAVSLASELKQYFELAASLNVEIPVSGGLQMSVLEMQVELSSLHGVKVGLESFKQRLLLVSEKERLLAISESLIASMKGEIELIESRKAAIFSSIASLGSVEKDIVSLQLEIDKVGRELTSLLVQKASLDKEREGIASNVKSLSEEVARKEAAKAELESAANLSYWLEEMFVNLVGVIERHVLMKVQAEFNTLFSDWFSMLMGNESLTAKLDDEFTPIVEADGFIIPVENLSGGEKTSCALAYRLALNMVINNLVSTIKTRDILILDEPTDGFSAEQLDKLRDVLSGLGLPQVILVSHEERIESFVQNVIRVQKEQHVSRVVR